MTFTEGRKSPFRLVEETGLEGGMELFQNNIKEGRSGLCITRIQPNFGDQATKPWKSFRLSQLIGMDKLRPDQLGIMKNVIFNFIDNNDRAVIFLEGVDYLVLEKELDEVLKLIYAINDRLSEKNGVLIISLDPVLFDEIDYARIRRDVSHQIKATIH